MWVQLIDKSGAVICGPDEFGAVPGPGETFASGGTVYRITGTRQHTKMKVPLPMPAERVVTIVTVEKLDEKGSQVRPDRKHPVRG